MAEQTAISWCDHTFNPWHGCVKVSPACTNCYAERQSKSWPNFHDGVRKPLLWGLQSERRFFGDDHWKEPLRWNKSAKAAGVRRRVFCASMSDWAEVPTDRGLLAKLDRERMRLARLIEITTSLDWLLLTKRAGFIMRCVPRWWCGGFPDNAWCGTSTETQGWLEERLIELLGVPSRVRFLSIEPMLSEMNLRRVRHKYELGEVYVDALTGRYEGDISAAHVPTKPRGVQWVIAGAESGNGTDIRASHPDWFRSLRDQCQAAGVAFHFKQWGEWMPDIDNRTTHSAGIYLQRETSNFHTFADGVVMVRVGKKAAGRLLDGREWNEFAEVRA